MKVWTYGEMVTKLEGDLDLEDETFIKSDEMVGYLNEALAEASSEIIVLNQDYFLTEFYVPTVQGTTRYDLPYNIYANKIRGVVYTNGSVNYEIARYRRKNKFMNKVLTQQFGLSEWYQYDLQNDNVGQTQIEFLPTMRDTAILAPVASVFAPIRLYYIRNCARVPISGEYCNPELIMPTQVNVSSETVQTYAGTSTYGVLQKGAPGGYPGSVAYITGDAVQLQAGPQGTLPSPLVAGTTYYVIQTGAGVIKFATSRANALAGTAINLTTTGTVYFIMRIAAVTRVIMASLIDIPEFATFIMQWVKCRCYEKETDPRLVAATALLAQQKGQMVDTLSEAIVDDDTTIQGDFSIYEDMN